MNVVPTTNRKHRPATESGDVVIFVLGMARSGSSATARLLSLCGGRLPEALLPPNRSNPTGYWEPRAAVHTNARFLQACGSSFFDTQLVQGVSEDTPQGIEFIEEIAAFLRACQATGSSAPLVIKDPRISVLLPFWLAAAESTGLSPHVVIPIRHPVEVAASLGRWKGLTNAHVAELWLKYNLLSERHTRHLPRAFISFAKLLVDWRAQARSICEALRLDLTLNDQVDEFLDPQLRHEVSEHGDVRIDTPWLRDVHDVLAAACDGEDVDIGVLDAAFVELDRAQATGSLPVVRSFGTDFGVDGT
jgi:hypothetical protein